MENREPSYSVMVVDDDQLNLKIAGHILSDNGIEAIPLKSGSALLESIDKGDTADLILLDILMPDPDGFETFKELRQIEAKKGLNETPVVFLTSNDDKDMESKGLSMGAVDFIRKPFDPDVLIHRLQNILSKSRLINELSEEAATDGLTGLLNKESVNKEIESACTVSAGALCIIDLDSFKLVNDIYGHEVGDKILMAFADLLKTSFRTQDVVGRIGGDEFIAFLKSTSDEEAVKRVVRRLNDRLLIAAKKMLGEDMTIPLGVSGGAAITPGGDEFAELFNKADKCLLYIKQNGKHDCSVWHGEGGVTGAYSSDDDMRKLNMILDERNVANHALFLGREAFGSIYRYMIRYMQRYNEKAYKVLFTISPLEDFSDGDFRKVMDKLGEILMNALRNSDIMMQSSANKFFLLLPMVSDADIGRVIERIMHTWERSEFHGKIRISYETEAVTPNADRRHTRDKEEKWVIVVDDDILNLKTAGHLLSENGMRVTALNSGKALLDYIAEGNHPDMILLDVIMPGLDGFETLGRLRKMERPGDHIPVIFLTASDDGEVEAKGLRLGAIDFIKKPFIPEVLTIRVMMNAELVALQNNLSHEVERKTKENEQLFIQVMHSLADAIDAKDKYTKGHSGRVADYTREIARRYGYSEKEQDDIYMIGLLHDVGKIGVPDEVINKPSKLTDEEFAKIKAHPVMGAKILENIKDMPKLANGARYHHERFGGGGYPEGLKGAEIPEEARIIAVADAYDAMTSNRSYRGEMPQEKVRSEIEKGKGTQFDPKFADIMLDMIDGDKDYEMREHDTVSART